jgi:hypothetical protein
MWMHDSCCYLLILSLNDISVMMEMIWHWLCFEIVKKFVSFAIRNAKRNVFVIWEITATNRFLFPNYFLKIDAYSFFYIREVSFGKTAFLNEGKTETTERKRIMVEQQYSSLLSSSSSFLTDEPRKGSYCSKKMCWRIHDPTQCRRRKEKK